MNPSQLLGTGPSPQIGTLARFVADWIENQKDWKMVCVKGNLLKKSDWYVLAYGKMMMHAFTINEDHVAEWGKNMPKTIHASDPQFFDKLEKDMTRFANCWGRMD